MPRTTDFQAVELNREMPNRKVGFGAVIQPRSGQTSVSPQDRFIGSVAFALRAPNWNLPVIEQVRIHYDGPLSDSAISTSFSQAIDPLGSNRNAPPPGATAVESTMAEPGKFQTYVLIVAVAWHCEPEPLVFTAKGNALATPSSAIAMPVSPDMFDNQDIALAAGAANGPLGTASQELPAILDWAGWQEQAFYHMAHGFNLEWQYGNRTFLARDSLKNTMYVPSMAQVGSASSSEQDIYWYARLTNNYYRNGGLPAPTYIFLPIDRTRIGNFTMTPTGGTSTAGLSVFRPSRAYETIGATYGGMGIKSLLAGNQEFRRLTTPFLMRPGVPIGLRAAPALNSSNDIAEMQQWLAASFGGGTAIGSFGTPAVLSPDVFINAGIGVAGGGAVGMEPSLDATVAAQPITTFTQRVYFKGGSWKISVILKGFELTDQQGDMLKDPNVVAQLSSQCGCMAPGTSS